MNRVILVGRLTRDPDIRVTNTQMTVAHYTLAVDRRRKADGQQDTADFISCTAFGKSAEFVEKYLHKGTKIGVTGRIQTGSYINKDGQKVYTTDVIVDDHEFMESRAAAERNAAQAGQQYNAAVPNARYGTYNGQDQGPQQTAADPFQSEDFMNIPEMDTGTIPF